MTAGHPIGGLELEDQMDIEIARKRLADPKEVPIPYERVRKELGLD